MRGFRMLKQSGHLGRIQNIKRILTEQSLNLIEKDFSSVIMGAGKESGELIVRQYLLARFCDLNFNKALLRSLGNKKGKVVYGMPREWRKIINKNGFKTANFQSEIYWRFYLLGLIGYGIIRIITNVYQSTISLRKNVAKPQAHVFFNDLTPNNIPGSEKKSKTHDIISWYIKSKVKQNGIKEIYHSAKQSYPIKIDKIQVVSRKNLEPNLVCFKTILKYCFWGICAIFIALIDLLRGHWWNALLFNQATLSAKIRFLPQEFIAKEYLFHQSGWIYRPLWTYEAAKRGSIITLYFYGTNIEGFKRKESYPHLNYGWKAMNWPNYLVWDEYQSNFIKRAAIAPYKINIVGQIWMQGKIEQIEKSKKKNISIFDITPVRDSFYATLGLEYDYYTPENCVKFLYDSYNSINSSNCSTLWKKKREIGTLAHIKHRRYSEQLETNKNIVLVDPDLSAIQVIENSIAVISMPFTSTALIARELGKPSVYYDPSGLLQKNDRAAHGIPILSGQEELKDWMSNLVNDKTI